MVVSSGYVGIQFLCEFQVHFGLLSDWYLLNLLLYLNSGLLLLFDVYVCEYLAVLVSTIYHRFFGLDLLDKFIVQLLLSLLFDPPPLLLLLSLQPLQILLPFLFPLVPLVLNPASSAIDIPEHFVQCCLLFFLFSLL